MLLAITTPNEALLFYAKQLAARLNLPLIDYADYSATKYSLLLVVTNDKLELQDRQNKNSKPIFVDFLSNKLIYRLKYSSGNKQLIAKAVGIKSQFRPIVIDATAGFGVDSFILAYLGCKVTMLERSLVMSVLLEDGLRRLKNNSNYQNINLSLYNCQAVEYFKEAEKPDVIYFDPMYPPRKKSALGANSMRTLHKLVGADEDAASVLDAALKCAKKRVVVKRQSHADCLGLLKPDLRYSLGASCRYDVYLKASC